MNNIYIITLVVILLFILAISLAVKYGIKVTLMYDRKSKEQMIEELNNNFKTDYNNYTHLPSEEITIKSDDNLNLKGVYHNVHPNSNKVVLINHGYTANRYVGYQFTDVFFEEGYNVLLIDMRSHGESEGEFASYGYNESSDIGCWVRWIKKRVGKDAYIGLHGQSMGAASVMIYGGTHSNEVKFIIEDCGFTTARDAIKSQFASAKIPFWPLYNLIRIKAKMAYRFDLDSISPKEAIINSNIPILFIHGKEDNIVPTWMSSDLYNSKKGSKDRLYLVDRAGHMEAYSTNKSVYKNVVKDFLKNNLM